MSPLIQYRVKIRFKNRYRFFAYKTNILKLLSIDNIYQAPVNITDVSDVCVPGPNCVRYPVTHYTTVDIGYL
jgi:hypothetical protein